MQFYKIEKVYLLGLDFCYGTFILCGWKKAYISELSNRNLYFLNSSIGIISNVDIDWYCFTVMIQLKIDFVSVNKLKNPLLYRSSVAGDNSLTSLSKLASKWILFGFSINSLLTSMDGCSPNFDGAYIIFLIAKRTEFRLCGLSSMCSPTNAFSS